MLLLDRPAKSFAITTLVMSFLTLSGCGGGGGGDGGLSLSLSPSSVTRSFNEGP